MRARRTRTRSVLHKQSFTHLDTSDVAQPRAGRRGDRPTVKTQTRMTRAKARSKSPQVERDRHGARRAGPPCAGAGSTRWTLNGTAPVEPPKARLYMRHALDTYR